MLITSDYQITVEVPSTQLLVEWLNQAACYTVNVNEPRRRGEVAAAGFCGFSSQQAKPFDTELIAPAY